tara:strand:- start:268 stop:456 length:189 start_codon:yes stop_codon:yes gene_type:complete
MEVFFITLLAFIVACVALALGVLLKGKPLKGSCGGLNNLYSKDGKASCDICGANGDDIDFCD